MDSSLWERLLVAATGPILTAALALLVLNRVSGRFEQRRENQATRERLASEINVAAAALYLATQRFWRAARDIRREDRRNSDQLKDALDRLDDTYEASRVSIQRLEDELARLFKEPSISETCHQVGDLLTVRYFQLTSNKDLDVTYEVNERDHNGKKHSGLTKEELSDVPVLLDTYRKARASVLESVRSSDFVGSAPWWSRARGG